jgi:hypothetical protein
MTQDVPIETLCPQTGLCEKTICRLILKHGLSFHRTSARSKILISIEDFEKYRWRVACYIHDLHQNHWIRTFPRGKTPIARDDFLGAFESYLHGLGYVGQGSRQTIRTFVS